MSFKTFFKNEASSDRIDWVDQVKGLTIFLVVYGHNFPFTEKYIYTFHMPLFFMISGFFHPKTSRVDDIKKRGKSLLVPYFIWSLFLFIFWFFVSSRFGDSVALNLSPIENFIGIFYSQGDRFYMDWGIPMWFLPGLFMTFLIFYWLQKIKSQFWFIFSLIILPTIGGLYARNISMNLPWSINIAMVALGFYGFGFYGFKIINAVSRKNSLFFAVGFCIVHFLTYNYNLKIDMYRAHYGNESFFILSGITGSLFVLFFFKSLPYFPFLAFIGKFSLIILALQLISMSFIKFVLLYGFHQSDFNFSEWKRFVFAILQIFLLVPSFFIINKYLPLLNGGYKKI